MDGSINRCFHRSKGLNYPHCPRFETPHVVVAQPSECAQARFDEGKRLRVAKKNAAARLLTKLSAGYPTAAAVLQMVAERTEY
jgi:hypothetical protein